MELSQKQLLFDFRAKIDFLALIDCLGVRETRFSLNACGGLPSLLPINSPDIIAHIKGLSYLSDYMVIRASLGGAF